jgi:predicted dehydrogenase
MMAIIKRFASVAAIVSSSVAIWAAAQPAPEDSHPIRVGMIGLDTSHVVAFTQLLNDPKNSNHVPGARVVAAYKGGSPDIESSRSRVEGFTATLRDKWQVEIVPDIRTLCAKVDAVMIESVDGRPHLEQARPVFAAKKPVFIDKPMAGSLADVKEMFRLSRESGAPCFCSSSYRFMKDARRPELGKVVGCDAGSACSLEPHHPDLFWYGIHGVEALFTIMGTGCVEVSRTSTPGMDVVVGRWNDGRVGIFRGFRTGREPSSSRVYCEKGSYDVEHGDYKGLVEAIVEFFRTGKPPVSPEETIEIYAFMEAADASKKQGGKAVALDLK